MSLRGRRYDTGDTVEIEIRNGKISELRAISSTDNLPWIAPGFVDLQVNGCGGQEFNDRQLTVEKVEQVSRAMDADGVTWYCPTATTHSYEMLSHTLQTLARACHESDAVARRAVGFHLEGPYISNQEGPRGAHPEEHCRPPDWDEFQRLQEAADGRIRILTMSPEYEGSPEFIERVVESGVVVALGHTAADSQQIRDAVDAGARMSTHLGNGAHAMIRRHPNYIWDQLADDRLTATLIVDGQHLPAAVVKCFLRAKTSARTILVSDLVGMAGMPPGRYEQTSVGDIEILEDGRVVVAGQRQYLAGAAFPLTLGVSNVMLFTDLDLRRAMDMASRQPAQAIHETPVEIEVGARGDLILFELPTQPGQPLLILETLNCGETVYRRAE